MRQRFYCQNCKKVLEYDQTVADNKDKEKRNCKTCGHTVIPNNFSQDNKQYATRDPYKAAALFCMGAKLKETDVSDPQNVAWIFTHEKIAQFVSDYHSARLATYDIDPSELMDKHKGFMKVIREARLNDKYAKRQGGK